MFEKLKKTFPMPIFSEIPVNVLFTKEHAKEIYEEIAAAEKHIEKLEKQPGIGVLVGQVTSLEYANTELKAHVKMLEENSSLTVSLNQALLNERFKLEKRVKKLEEPLKTVIAKADAVIEAQKSALDTYRLGKLRMQEELLSANHDSEFKGTKLRAQAEEIFNLRNTIKTLDETKDLAQKLKEILIVL
jgi:hypothetical protein